MNYDLYKYHTQGNQIRYKGKNKMINDIIEKYINEEEKYTFSKYGCTSHNDIYFKNRDGKYLDISSECGGTWIVSYDSKRIGKGHDKRGTGYKSREEAFDWVNKELNLKLKWSVVRDDSDD